jgi:hypothetical protein
MLKNKARNGHRIGEPEKCTLRMLRSDDAFQASPMSMEATLQESICDSQKAIRDAILEAEYSKAKALLTFRNSVRFC